jgi:hypothetical protein
MTELINLSSYTQPKAIEDKRKKWVAYGEDNDYYRFLIDNYINSATNNAAIRSISDLIYGRGLSIEDMDEKSSEVSALRDLINHRDLKRIILERKMLGQSAMQVIYSGAGNNRKVVKIKHFPIETLRPEKMNAEGVIEAYYYHPNWVNIKPNDELKRIPTFGNSKEKVELFIIQPYMSGYYYFSPVDYSGAIAYVELEREISDYLLNDAKNSFSGTKVINMNNGVPDQEQRELITRDIKAKLTGSRGQKVIVAFNESAENKTTVEDISLTDAPAHYEYLAAEARDKILVGHRVTSPMLLGIRETGGGLGNNADEILTASQLFNSTVISIYQDEVIEALEEILEINGEAPNMYFITAQPIEFTEEDQNDTEAKGGATGDSESVNEAKDETNLSAHANFNPEEQIDWLTYLSKKGEQIEDLEGWELISSEIDENEAEDEDWEAMLNADIKLNLASAPADKRANPSEQDTPWVKVRYAYVQGSRKYGKSSGGQKKQRAFCTAMESAKRIYRKEDIIKMQSDGVNSELGHNKAPYSIWRHKGGVNCHHKWERRIYMKRTKADGTPWGGGAMNGVYKATKKEARKGGYSENKKKFKNDTRVAEAQIDRADRGHHPSYSKNK